MNLDIFLGFLVFFLGASVGSFLNVVIERTRSKQAFWKGRSFCPACKHKLAYYDLLPLFSFLWLKAKCRYCKKKIAWQYFWVELATAVVFVAQYFYWGYENYWALLFWWVMSGFLIIIFLYDLKYQLIYDRFSLPAIALALGWQFWQGNLEWWSILGGLLLGGGSYLLLYLFSKGKDVGGGDIRLGALLGALVGVADFLYWLLFSYLIAIIFLLSYIIVKRRKIKYLPLGPFLILGFIVVYFFGAYTIPVVENIFGQVVDFLI